MPIYFAGGCLTVTGKICIFPFTLAGTTHYACTTQGNQNSQERAWCSTKVDGNGVHIGGQGNWGECGLGCPIEEVSGNNLLEKIPTTCVRCAKFLYIWVQIASFVQPTKDNFALQRNILVNLDQIQKLIMWKISHEIFNLSLHNIFCSRRLH